MNNKIAVVVLLLCVALYFGRRVMWTATWAIYRFMDSLLGIACIVGVIWALSTLLKRR